MASLRSKLKFPLRHPVVVADVGCRCRKANFSSFCSPNPKKRIPTPKSNHYSHSPSYRIFSISSSSSSSTTSTITTASSPQNSVEGVAVVKESRDPYRDFQDSMISMILEKEIYEWDELCILLHHFLVLNSPHHHDAIVRAFTEILAQTMGSNRG